MSPSQSKITQWRLLHTLLFAVIASFTMTLALPDVAFASTTSGGTDSYQGSTAGGTVSEWEEPLKKFTQSFTGPVAFAIALLSIVVCVAGLIFGGELSDFVRRLMMVVLGAAIIFGASSFLSNLGITGATVS